MIEENRWKGSLAELAIAKCLLEKGYNISFPYGQNQRYDLVVEIDGHLKKVQCKTARLKNSRVEFNCCGTNGPYQGQVDYIAAYCKELNQVYLMPISDVGVSVTSLRLEKTKNGSKHRMTKDFEVKNGRVA